ncbi:MAG: hydantoinase B/oxoprolinase family protein [Lautropia sp.]
MSAAADTPLETRRCDPVTTGVINHALAAIAGEMTINLARTAHSTIVYEVQDFCTGLLDAQGRLVAQAPGGLPLFVGDLDAPVADGLEIFGTDGFSPGDVVLTNHTGTCGQHLNNMVVYTPAFFEGGLIGFSVTRAHWTDVGSRLAGGFLTDAVSSFEEGIQVRSVKLYKAGVPDQDLFRILRHNIRDPEGSFGDLDAQIAACRLGERRLGELYSRYGAGTVCAAIAAGWEQTERIVRDRIRAFSPGVYQAETMLDDDGVEIGKPVPIRVSVTVDGDRLKIDFSAMSPQVRGPINSGAAAGRSAARLALKYLVAPDLMASHGCFQPLEVVLPTGTLISAVEPAAMSWWQTPILSVIDTILLAMSKASPHRIPAAHYCDISAMLLTGVDTARGRAFTSIEPVAGGWGARPNGDGPSATYTIGHGDTFNVPVEVLETRFPLRVEAYRLRCDSGGAGRFRGGLGVERIYRILDNGQFNGLTERTRCPPWGLEGGLAGRPGSIAVRRAGSSRLQHFRKVTGLKLARDDVFVFCTGGGGGYGHPFERPVQDVAADVVEGLVSRRQARALYGVVLERRGARVDASATGRLRGRPEAPPAVALNPNQGEDLT